MWPSWFPVDYGNNRFWYYSVNMYQFVASLFNAYVFTAIDVFSPVLYKLLGAHFNVLAMQLENVGYAGDLGRNPNNKRMVQNEEHLRHCFEYHMLCSRF